VRAVLITGPPGAGKTSVLTALVDALSDDDVAHAALEVEAVVWTHPALDEEPRLRHVRVMSALLRKAGRELLLVADTVETEDELARLIEAVDADEAFVVRLRAEPETLAERIIAREPPRWSGLAALVEHAKAMAPVAGADLELSTEGQTPDDVAAQIRKTARL
jgi:chloramphenicol 3-O-phosphotransferase